MEIRELLQYIPTEHFRDQNEWLFVANASKAAGVSEANFDEWCRRDPEKYDRDVITRYHSLKPRETAEHAERRLLKIARENGYTYKGEFKYLPPVVLKPCFRAVNKPHDDQISIFEAQQARQDAIKLLALLGSDFITADYIKEEYDGKCRIRPHQEKAEKLSLAELEKGDKFQGLENLELGHCFLLNQINEAQWQSDREAGTAKGVKKEHFISYDWCLVESDEGTIAEQWNKILSLDLPLLAVVHSGNKSLHCICHIGASSETEYEQRTEMLMSYCLSNGFKVDTATKNVNRWVRFPYAARNGKMQYPVKVHENYRTFNQWQREAVYHIDIFDRTVVKKAKSSDEMAETKIELNIASMVKLLQENGFRRNIAGNIFYKVEGKFVRQVTEGEIQTFLYVWMKDYYPEDLNIFAHSKWEPTRLKALDPIPDERHTDSQDGCFFYFKRTAVRVSSRGIEKVPYMDVMEGKKIIVPGLEGYIDAKQMIDHDLTLTGEDGVFSMFVRMICNHEPERIKALMSALGYLMHRHKDRSRVKAIVLTDESLTDENGGTGKGLLFQALKQMRFCQAADMKTRVQNQFFFSTVEKGCSIFHMDDVQQSFDFNILFNVLADDMETESKGVNRKIIPFEESPKIYMSTNFAFKDMEKDSYRRRMAVYELYRYFTADHQPTDEFGHSFFHDWDRSEWNLFYNFMLQCSFLYMREGLVEYEAKFAKEKSLRAEFQGKEEFLDFIQTWETEGLLGKQITNEELSKRWHDEKGIEISPARLKKLLMHYCEQRGYEMVCPRTAKVKSFIITKPEK